MSEVGSFEPAQNHSKNCLVNDWPKWRTGSRESSLLGLVPWGFRRLSAVAVGPMPCDVNLDGVWGVRKRLLQWWVEVFQVAGIPRGNFFGANRCANWGKTLWISKSVWTYLKSCCICVHVCHHILESQPSGSHQHKNQIPKSRRADVSVGPGNSEVRTQPWDVFGKWHKRNQIS